LLGLGVIAEVRIVGQLVQAVVEPADVDIVFGGMRRANGGQSQYEGA
jgi:hypothetical protein